MSTIVLISCSSKKLAHKAKAKHLYISPLFRMNLAFSLSLKPKKIFILSAKYGLVDLDQTLEPYNQTLNTMKNKEIIRWAEKVKHQLENRIDFDNDTIVFLAGVKYRKYLINYFNKVIIPLEGMGIGKQLQYLKRKINNGK